MTHPRISNDRDTEALEKYAMKLRNTVANMKVCGVQPGRELYLSATQKIPRAMLVRFFERHDDSECDIEKFSDWLVERLARLKRVDQRLFGFGQDSSTQATRREEPRAAQGRVTRTFTTEAAASPTTTQAVCFKCHGRHRLEDCGQFKALPMWERWQFVSLVNLCSQCLQVGHWAKDCQAGRCGKCDKRHHPLLHSNPKRNNHPRGDRRQQQPSQRPAPATSAAPSAAAETHHVNERRSQELPAPAPTEQVSFMTVPVILVNGHERRRVVALLDPASSASYVKEEVAKQLRLSGPSHRLEASVIGGANVSGMRQNVKVTLESVEGGLTADFDAWVMPTVTGTVAPVPWRERADKWRHLQDLPFAKVEVGDEIDLLIGLNAIDLHSVLDERHGEPGDPIARKTPLGWVCFGPVLTAGTSDSPTVRSCQTHVASTFFSAADSRLNDIVESFWELENVGMKTPYRTPAEAEAEDYVSRTMGLTDEGRVQVAIPWIGQQGKPDLKSNRQMAERRLESLERSLRKHGPVVEKEYSRVLEAQEAKGYIRKVKEEEVQEAGDDQWYLPHFPVVRQDKATTKVRVVYDAAAKCGKSLNDEMHAGPKLQNDLVRVLLRFCKEPVALVADIAEMFLQVKVAEKDRKYLRFLWRTNPQSRPEVFEFTRLVFGLKASPYLAGKALKEVLARHGEECSQEVRRAVDESVYVDDLLHSEPTVQAAIETCKQAQETLDRGGFHLRKWISTHAKVLATIQRRIERHRSPSASATMNIQFCHR